MIVIIIVLAVIAGLLSIENLLWGQFMFSRMIIFIPILTIIFLLFNLIPSNYRYILFGGAIILELYFLFAFPIGSSYVPDTVASGIMFIIIVLFLNKNYNIIINKNNWAVFLVVSLIISILSSYAGAYFDILLRRFDIYIVEYAKKDIVAGNFHHFEQISKYGYILFFTVNFFEILLYSLIIFFLLKPITLLIKIGPLNKIMILFLLSFFAYTILGIIIRIRRIKFPIFQIIFLLALTILTRFGIVWNLVIIIIAVIFILNERKKLKNG